MDTRLLTYFVSIAEHKNMTHAARALHIAQPALSVAIKKLENQLELELFRRDERKMILTHEGEVLLTHAKQILQQLDDATLAMKELRGLEKGEVRLGVPSIMGTYYFPDVLMAFKSRYPKLKLTIVDAGAQSIQKMLLDGEIDLGITQIKNLPNELDSDHLLRSQMVAVVSNEHEFSDKKSLTFSEFFSQELVMFKQGYFHREKLDAICKQEGLTANFSFETNLLAVIMKIVKRDFAISALLELATENEPDIVSIPFSEPIYLDISIAWRKNGYLSKADRTFLEFVKQNH
ncbi:LysR family transcriptional regulator [Aliivibrio fischeri]|uniref:LysR family transcriptional regulator n=1 Tax=Aliivibrio fischeri TaxID=668 RepID=UPI00080E2BEA|nr:LysR family transcriptional regulator [Aliivibrio fischeri]OCH08311.1 LysR family transcriptional regulator [Aliivibrio fischeri]OCH29348.1 LysR family transcriptional regulator [Aliivibrio fischeri]OCH62253.1 LysR family transcriptional regulator [Aliivibrio fischeri]